VTAAAVLEAVRHRRMHRRFSGEPVAPNDVRAVVEAATRAPMAGNQLLRRLVVVTEPALLKTLREVTPGFTANPRVVLAICTDTALAEDLLGAHGRDISSYIDVGAAAENAALAAVALGLGACFARSCTDAALRVVLDLPKTVRPDLLVGIGHPATAPSRAPRTPAAVVYGERFGEPWSLAG
jgi:nitroreductase